MRIIGGQFKGRLLHSPKDDKTRPTSDKARQALFNILDIKLEKSRRLWRNITFLDVFAGTGAVGIEALSRGAKKSFFIENHIPAILCIKDNLKSIDNGVVVTCDACCPPFCTKPVDIAFLDAPYTSQLWEKSLCELQKKGWINADSMIIVEIENKEEITLPSCFKLKEDRLYGRNRLLICQFKGNTAVIQADNLNIS